MHSDDLIVPLSPPASRSRSPALREKSLAVDKDDLVQVKETFKWVMQGAVAQELGGVPVVIRVGGTEGGASLDFFIWTFNCFPSFHFNEKIYFVF